MRQPVLTPIEECSPRAQAAWVIVRDGLIAFDMAVRERKARKAESATPHGRKEAASPVKDLAAS